MKPATLALLLALQGCVCPDWRGFVTTQREFYDTIEEPHRRYVDQDPNLTAEKKARRHGLLDAEEAALQEAEASQ